MNYKAIAGLGAALTLASAGSAAAPIVFDLTTGGSFGLGTFTKSESGIDLTLSESHVGRIFVRDSIEGIGIAGFESPDIDGPDTGIFALDPVAESLTVSFSEAVTINSITFGNWDNNDDVTFSGLTLTSFGDNSGVAAINELVSSFSLSAEGSNDDFRLKSITVSAVPIPAAAWLFGSALIGMVGLRRKR